MDPNSIENKTDADAYNALFRSYEIANKRIKDLNAQIAILQKQIAKIKKMAKDWHPDSQSRIGMKEIINICNSVQVNERPDQRLTH